MHAVIVTGSRDWSDRDGVYRVLAELPPDTIVIHGGARGADGYADQCARSIGHTVIEMPAQWERDGKSAGPTRNSEMLSVLGALGRCGYTVSVHAFSLPQSRGTAHMKRIAAAAGFRVLEHGRTE